MSLGVGSQVGKSEAGVSGINGRSVFFGNQDNVSTSNGFAPPNARGKGSAFTNKSISMQEDGTLVKLLVLAIAKTGAARDVVISINNTDLESSRLTFSTAGVQSVVINEPVSKGDEISIRFPIGGTSSDDFAWSLDIVYGSGSNEQTITCSEEITVTTTFTRSSYAFVQSNVSQIPCICSPPYDAKMLKCRIKVITAPTAGDSVILTRRVGASTSMTGTSNQTILDSQSDDSFFDLEDDISFNAGDELNIGWVRVGSAGVAPVIVVITVWDWTQ